jgi:hypothetical protein
VGVAIDKLAARFYVVHPEYVLHPQWPLEFHFRKILDGLAHLERHLGDVTPILFHAGPFYLLALAVLAWHVLRTRDWKLAAAGVTLAAGVIVSFGIPKTYDGEASVAFAYSRVFLALPLVLALFALWAADRAPPVGALMSRRAASLVLAVIAVAGLAREATLGGDIARIMAIPGGKVTLVSTDRVLRRCGQLRELAMRHDAGLVIEASSPADAYACGALWYGEIDTLYPSYERRTARALAEANRRRASILVSGAPQFPAFSAFHPQRPNQILCGFAQNHGIQCEPELNEVVALTLPPPYVSAFTVSEWLNIPVRKL